MHHIPLPGLHILAILQGIFLIIFMDEKYANGIFEDKQTNEY